MKPIFALYTPKKILSCHLKKGRFTIGNYIHLYTPTIDFRWYVSFHWVTRPPNVCRNESLCLRGGDLIVVNNKRAAHRWRCEHAQLRLIHGSRGACLV